MRNPFLIRDARSFYASIKSNPLYETLDDETVIGILEQEFKVRLEASQQRGLTGWKLKEFIFWQGAHLGCVLMAKIFRHHVEATAHEQGVNLADQNAH